MQPDRQCHDVDPSRAQPADLYQLKQMIASGQVVLHGRLQSAARFALEHPETMAMESARGISQRAGVSRTTAWNLAIVLGFRSYSEFRKLFQNDPLSRVGRRGNAPSRQAIP